MAEKHYALVTGASKGIGKAIATELARRGVNILAVARSESLLSELCTSLKSEFKVDARYFPADLLEEGMEVRMAKWVRDQKVPLNILVNNAGYGLWGRFADMDLSDMRRMLRLNNDSLIALCHEFIPMLKEQPKAWIMNVGSTAGYQAVPTMAAYSGSKALVNTFTRALRFELKKSPISVTLLSPGATESEFTTRAGMQAMQKTADKFNMTAEKVAKIGVRGMFRGKAEIIPGFTNKITVWAARHLPKWLIERMAANIYEKHLPK
ncbi:MAG: SDR family oxidoreductase [Bacteroidota bacterium]